MLVEKFLYTPLDRTSVEGRRMYSTPDGARVPSVTTVLDRTKPEEARRALQEWKRRVGTEQAQQITTEAANRGTKMHTYLEHYIKTGELRPRPNNPFAWASHAMAQTVIDQGLRGHVDEFWGVEVPLYFPQVYAGTTDGVGLHQGQPAILDYKQTNKPKRREWIGDYFLQLAAYAAAHNELHGTDIRRGVIMMCVRPEQDASMNITVAPQYQQFVLEGDEFDHYTDQWWKRLEQYYLSA